LPATSLIPLYGSDQKQKKEKKVAKDRKQLFNMCGYAAPKIDTVRVGFIGLGSRGPGHVMNMSYLEGVEIKGLCDMLPEEVEK
jgi:hypothetical protein